MADSLQGSLEEDDSLLDALLYNNGKQNLDLQALALQASMSKSEGKSTRRKSLVRPSLETEDLLNLLHGSDPVKVELNRLENEVRGKLPLPLPLPLFHISTLSSTMPKLQRTPSPAPDARTNARRQCQRPAHSLPPRA